jgi:alcohol dehydrogenase (cytochrome c)
MRLVALILLGMPLAGGDAEWVHYGKDPAGRRFSELTQIHAGNVAQLVPTWMFQTGVLGKHEATPLVRDGVMYVTGPENHAWALDAATGRPLWRYAKRMPVGLNVCCGLVNRGFAMLDDRLFKVNLQNTLVALDTKTGSVLWESPIEDHRKGYSSTVAPLIAKNLVVVGIAGAEFGTRGFIDAYDAKSGKRAWRFWTVPAPGEEGGKTWASGWERGGGSTWVTGTYDPELNLIYWGTGNPGPDMDGDVRPGDNLYTCSLVALDADTGKRKWHFQFTPHDVHDWDATEDPVLLDIERGGAKVKAVVMANRNGFFYALDRVTGELLAAKPYTEVSWASGVDRRGRPILIPGQDPTEEGNKACPGGGGGHNWQPTAFSPQTGLYYFGSTDGCHVYYKTNQEYVEGQWYQASTFSGDATFPKGSIVALNPATGDAKWRFPMVTPPSSGVLATAGGLLFSGDRDGYFFALDAKSGKPLWRFPTGGMIIAGPITWSLGGKQFVTVAAGSTILTFGLP